MNKNTYVKTQESGQKIVGYYHYIKSAFRQLSKFHLGNYASSFIYKSWLFNLRFNCIMVMDPSYVFKI
jgi:hypothetical protein